MNRTDYDLEKNQKSWDFLGEKVSNYLSGLAAFMVVVFFSISLVLVTTIKSVQELNKIGLLSYLIFSVLGILLYSAVTTKTANGSIEFKLMQLIKRLIDVLLVALSIFTLTPVLILIALAIRIETPGPVIYKDKRLGQFGRYIYLYKFRTMHVANGEKKELTRIGKFLRRTSLSELPSMYNVLNGDLSLVGPRPRFPDDFGNSLEEEIILRVKPGITGSWQLSPYRKSMKKRNEMDLEYVKNWSLLKDLKLIIKSVFVVYSGKK